MRIASLNEHFSLEDVGNSSFSCPFAFLFLSFFRASFHSRNKATDMLITFQISRRKILLLRSGTTNLVGSLNEIVFTEETERNTVSKTIIRIACSLLISFAFRSRSSQRNDKRLLPLDVRLYVQYTSSSLFVFVLIPPII